ncbi:MAG: hypothetical protein R3F43_21040 [bacterium]
MEAWTLFIVVGALGLVVLDVSVPSGGLLSGVGIAAPSSSEASRRWGGGPGALADGGGHAAHRGIVIRSGAVERDALPLPASAPTSTAPSAWRGGAAAGRGGARVVELEGDYWTARLADGSPAATPGARIVVEAMVDQIPVVRVVS